MKVYKNKNVLEAARERMAWLFDEFERVVVSSSSGKDSTVVLELALDEARKRGRLPLKVCFIDQEAEWHGTIEYIEYLLTRKEIELWWVQIPFYLDNASSFENDTLKVWDPEAKWIRPKNPRAVTENVFGEYGCKKERLHDFHVMFDQVIPKVAGGEPFVNLYGMRAEESPHRRLAMIKGTGGYKSRPWTVAQAGGWRAGVIFDWTLKDVWTAIGKFDWRYNRIYDQMFQYGIRVPEMRVSSLVHGIASYHALKILQELEPDNYEALVKRMPGIDTFSKLQNDIVNSTLPPAFTTWKEYVDYLLDNIVTDKVRAAFKKLFAGSMARRLGSSDAVFKAFAMMVQTNDYLGVRLANIALNCGGKSGKPLK